MKFLYHLFSFLISSIVTDALFNVQHLSASDFALPIVTKTIHHPIVHMQGSPKEAVHSCSSPPFASLYTKAVSVLSETSRRSLERRSEDLYALRLPLQQQEGYVAIVLPKAAAVAFCSAVSETLHNDSLQKIHDLDVVVLKSTLKFPVREDIAEDFCENIKKHGNSTLSGYSTSLETKTSTQVAARKVSTHTSGRKLDSTKETTPHSYDPSIAAISKPNTPRKVATSMSNTAAKDKGVSRIATSKYKITSADLTSILDGPSATTTQRQTSMVILSTSAAPSLRTGVAKDRVPDILPPSDTVKPTPAETEEIPSASEETITPDAEDQTTQSARLGAARQHGINRHSSKVENGPQEQDKLNVGTSSAPSPIDKWIKVQEIHHRTASVAQKAGVESPTQTPSSVNSWFDRINKQDKDRIMSDREPDKKDSLPSEMEAVNYLTLARGPTRKANVRPSETEASEGEESSSLSDDHDEVPPSTSSSRAPTKSRPATTTSLPKEPTSMLPKHKSSTPDELQPTNPPAPDDDLPTSSHKPNKPSRSTSTSTSRPKTPAGVDTISFSFPPSFTPSLTTKPSPPRSTPFPPPPPRTASPNAIISWDPSCQITSTQADAKKQYSGLTGCWVPIGPTSDSGKETSRAKSKGEQQTSHVDEEGGGGGHGVQETSKQGNGTSATGKHEEKSSAASRWGASGEFGHVVYVMWVLFSLQIVMGFWNFGWHIRGDWEVMGFRI